MRRESVLSLLLERAHKEKVGSMLYGSDEREVVKFKML